MSYPTVSHVAHDSYSSPQGGYPGAAPPPPPRPGFEQGYGPGPRPGPGPDYGPGYQGYFSDDYPPQVAHVHHSGPNNYRQQPYGYSYGQSDDYSRDTGISSSLRACLAALCCCFVLDQCCNPW